MYQNYRLPWEEEKKDIWVRKMPDNWINIHNSKLDFFTKWMWDYDLQDKFWGWYKKIKWWWKTACLVWIRTQESLDRWRTIFWDKRVFKYKDKEYSKQIEEDVFNFYPIYDWKTEDVWIANYKFSFDYNKVYDLFYQAWVPLWSMRIASPFNSYATSSLKLYKALDPNNWWKMLLRVNWVNFTWLYWDTTLMWWWKVKLPKWQTWKSYLNFLLSTLPKVSKDNYLNKLKVSKEFRKNKGGVLTDETIAELKKKKIKFEIWKTNVKTSKKPVKMNYLDDIQNVKEFQNIPTYKRMCICILKNDHNCRYMWFWLTKTETEKIQEAMAKYNNIF
jgi:predicted phosphoadenosine phosphosulfate sulfurtransferase